MATPFPALLRSRGRPSPLHRTRGKGSALPTDPTERGGPPPLVGLSPGLCGPGGTVAYFTHRTVRRQIQAAAVSAMGNIAEGFGRFSFEDKRRFLDIAFGSCAEVQSHLYVALDQAYITKADFEKVYQQAELVGRLISGSLTNLSLQIDGRSSTRSRTQRRGKQLAQE